MPKTLTAMLIRTLLLVALGLAASVMSACDLGPGDTEEHPEAVASDTTLAGRYFERAEHFSEAAQHDSALVYYEKASVLYEVAGAWEAYVRCYNEMGAQVLWMAEEAIGGRQVVLGRALAYLNHALEVGRRQWGERHPEVARSYFYRGRVYAEDQVFAREGSHDQALEYFNKALIIRRAVLGEQHPDVAESYQYLGYFYYHEGDYDSSFEYHKKALAIQRAVLGEQHPVVAISYQDVGYQYGERGDYDRALEHFKKAVAIQLAMMDEQHPDSAHSYKIMGLHYRYKSDLAHSYNLMGMHYRYKGDYDQALKYHNDALAINLATYGEQSFPVASTYNEIGRLYGDKGDYDQALEYQHKSLAIKQATLDEQALSMGSSYDDLGTLYRYKGDYDRALEYLTKALGVWQAVLGKRHSEVAATSSEIGQLYWEKGDYDRALEYLTTALEIWRVSLGEKAPRVAMSYNHLGNVYKSKGDYDRALKYYDKALANWQTRQGKQQPREADTYNSIGQLYWEKGNYDQALAYYQRALHANVPAFTNPDPYTNPRLEGSLSDDRLLESLAAKAQTLTARYASAPGHLADLEAAAATYRLIAELIDQVRHGYKAQTSKLTLAEAATGVYDQAIQTTLHLYRATNDEGHQRAAFLFAEKSKAGVLLDALAEARARRFAGIPDTLLDRERQLRIDLAGYETRLAQERARLLGEADSARSALWQDKLFGLKQSYQVLLAQFEAQYPAYYDLKYQTRTASVEEVQEQLLDEQSALVAYFTGADSLFIFTLTRDAFHVTSVARDTLLERQVAGLRSGIIEQDYERYTTSAYQLYQTLIEPVESLLRAEKLIIVPDGVLNYVPFEALLRRDVSEDTGLLDYRRLPYLIEDYAVSYTYSATLLLQTLRREREETTRDLLALAPVFPDGLSSDSRMAAFVEDVVALDATWRTRAGNGALPGSREEVLAIRDLFSEGYGLFERLFGRRTRVYLEEAARERQVKREEAARYRFVHLATHGFASEAAPELSRLLLAREDTTAVEDGMLHLGEVYTLRLNAEVVVLSACETGLGPLAQGEGIIGLARGFLYAGSENVVVSMWKASDAGAREVMVGFYGRMLDGVPRAEALREAKRGLIRGSAASAMPYYWAPFILIGK